MEVTLKEITLENWIECVRLQPSEEQKEFVASNLFSIAESKFHPSWEPLAIYANKIMVGFIMYGPEEGHEGRYWVIRLMIDQNHQRKGYGNAAMREALRRIKDKPDYRELLISFVPENIAARKLYESLGFVDTGEVEDEELVFRFAAGN